MRNSKWPNAPSSEKSIMQAQTMNHIMSILYAPLSRLPLDDEEVFVWLANEELVMGEDNVDEPKYEAE